MFNFIKKLFKKNKKQKKINIEENYNDEIYKKYVIEDLIDENKKNFLIIDDNEGVVSILKKDIEEILEENNIKDVNIVTLFGRDAALKFYITEKVKKYKIDYALIDLNFGANLKTKHNGNKKLNGIDVFESIYEINKSITYIFYTGNTLNMYVKNIENIINYFKKITKSELIEHILNKSQYNKKERKEIFYNIFFN